MQKIQTFLWFDNQAEEAVNFYISLFKNSKITAVARYSEVGPGPSGSVMTIAFELDGVAVTALNGGPHFKFTEAISMQANCESQAEIDRLWDALTADGGKPSQCGWLKDPYGLSWQIVPATLPDLMTDKDPERVKRAMAAILQMSKLDIAAIRAAAEG